VTDLLPSTRAGNVAVWSALSALVIAWVAVTSRSRDLPTIGDVARAVTRPITARWLLLAAWGWLGWHLFVRTTP